MNRGIYTVKIVRNIDKKLIQEWNSLWKRAQKATAFNSYEWFLTCITTYEIKQFELVVCYENNKLVGILPLIVAKQFGIRVASSLCDNFTIETPFLLENYSKPLVKAFFSAIYKKKNLYISKIDEEITATLAAIFPNMFFSIIATCPFIPFNEDPLHRVSKSTQKNVKKVLKDYGHDLKFELYDNSDDLEKYLEIMFTIEKNSSKQKRGRAIFSEEITKSFYKNTIKFASKFVRIGILYYQEKPIVYQYGFQFKDIFDAYQTSYLYEYRKLEPGKTMIITILSKLKEQSIKKLSLGGGISSYKEEFAKSYEFAYDLYSSKNPLIMTWWKMINRARRIKKVTFPEKYTRDHEFQYVVYPKSKNL